ncbi:MAG: hypothetical protein R3E57_10520 [Porticoccaceae bacterium]
MKTSLRIIWLAVIFLASTVINAAENEELSIIFQKLHKFPNNPLQELSETKCNNDISINKVSGSKPLIEAQIALFEEAFIYSNSRDENSYRNLYINENLDTAAYKDLGERIEKGKGPFIAGEIVYFSYMHEFTESHPEYERYKKFFTKTRPEVVVSTMTCRNMGAAPFFYGSLNFLKSANEKWYFIMPNP